MAKLVRRGSVDTDLKADRKTKKNKNSKNRKNETKPALTKENMKLLSEFLDETISEDMAAWIKNSRLVMFGEQLYRLCLLYTSYSSTRNSEKKITASQAILKGLADDGGLFVPESIPALDVSVEELSKMSYQQVAYEVMKLFLTDFTEEELKNCINRAYDSKFDTTEIAPLKFADGAYYLELFHGSTIAFKDMALSILPHLLITSAKKNNVKNEIVILTATSGDTGKAAMAGFAAVSYTHLLSPYLNTRPCAAFIVLPPIFT